MNKLDQYISEFLDNDSITSLAEFINKENDYLSANKIASIFGASVDFASLNAEISNKLVLSFKNNLTLLIQKTWVEKSDIALKEKLLYQLEKFLNNDNPSWKDNFPLFIELINQAVYLMFGQKTDSPDFAEYSIRIDPEFGIFWWYISSLPKDSNWTEEKYQIAIMLGMYFLANY